MSTEEEGHQPHSSRSHSFDDLARGLADGSISRGRAMKLMGVALLGGVLASIPEGAAFAAPPSTWCGSQVCRGGESL